eukprot:3441084-Prymnesium_polylepis.1
MALVAHPQNRSLTLWSGTGQDGFGTIAPTWTPSACRADLPPGGAQSHPHAGPSRCAVRARRARAPCARAGDGEEGHDQDAPRLMYGRLSVQALRGQVEPLRLEGWRPQPSRRTLPSNLRISKLQTPNLRISESSP